MSIDHFSSASQMLAALKADDMTSRVETAPLLGFPGSLQIIGPYLEDSTTLQLAELIEREWHSFQAPPNCALSNYK